jgi:hypothetical protein
MARFFDAGQAGKSPTDAARYALIKAALAGVAAAVDPTDGSAIYTDSTGAAFAIELADAVLAAAPSLPSDHFRLQLCAAALSGVAAAIDEAGASLYTDATGATFALALADATYAALQAE